MMTGSVRSGVATIPLVVRSPGGRTAHIDTVIDTGFNGEVSVSEDLVGTLGFTRGLATTCELADGTKVRVELFNAQVEWNGVWRPIMAASLAGGPLVGMGLLRGSHLGMDVVEDGRVEIRPLKK